MSVEDDMTALLKKPHLFGQLIGFDKLQNVHSCWIRLWLFSENDTALQAHRDSYKTTCIVVTIILLLLLDPNVTICVLRRTYTDAAAVVDQVKNLLERNAHVKEYFQKFQGTRKLKTRDWSRRRFSISTRFSIRAPQGNVEASGMDLRTGAHYQVIFADDFVTWRSRYFVAEREITKKAIQELQNIKGSGRVNYVGTVWDPDDAWKAVPVARPHKYPLGRVPLPAFTPKRVEQIQRAMPPSLFACNYLLKHELDEDLLFKDPEFAPAPPRARFTWGLDPGYDGQSTTALVGLWRDPVTLKIHAVARCWERNVSRVYDEILDCIAGYRIKGFHYDTVLKVEINADKGLSAGALQNRAVERKMKYLQIARISATENKHARISVRVQRIWPDLVLDPDRFEAGTAEDPEQTSRGPLEQLTRYSADSLPNDVPDAMSMIAPDLRLASDEDYGGSEVYAP